MDVRKLAHEVQDYVVSIRRELHQYPEVSLEEFRTTQRICEELDKMGVRYRKLDPVGVIAEVDGTEQGKIIALRADMDALTIQEQNDIDFKSTIDGMMHACGHDSHVAMLLGAVKVINSIKDSFKGTVRFVFQPAEEIGKGASLVIAQGGMENVDGVYGIHIMPTLPVGLIAGADGPAYAATDRFEITVKGKATHGAMPEGGVDATVCASALVMNLQTMVSREFPPMEPLVVTVGEFHSGSRWNIVSGEAKLTGTLRSFNWDLHNALPEVFKRVVEKTCETYRCEAEIEYIVVTNPLVNEKGALERGLASARKIQKEELVVVGAPTMGGEDFAEFTQFAPSAFFNLGAGGEYPIHSDHMMLDEAAFEVGVAMHVQCALDALAE